MRLDPEKVGAYGLLFGVPAGLGIWEGLRDGFWPGVGAYAATQIVCTLILMLPAFLRKS